MVASGSAAKAGAASRKVNKQTKLRKNITPGTVLILLSGQFRGKRVVFLKQLSSGLLLVTGPYSVNGVPLRRVNQRYVIATSTKVDASKVDSKKFEDQYFARDKKAKKAKKAGEDGFFAEEQKGKEKTSAERKADQKAVDGGLVAAIGKDVVVKKYLKARFSLSSNDKPHEMSF